MNLQKKIYRYILDWKLSRKMFFGFSLLVLLPTLSFSFYAYSHEHSTTLKNMEKVVTDSASQAALRIEDRMERFEIVMNSVMMNTYIGNVFAQISYTTYQRYEGLVEIYEPMMRSLQEMNPGIISCGIYTLNSTFTIRKPWVLPMSEIPDADWEAEVLQDHDIHWYADNGHVYAMGQLIKIQKKAPQSIVYCMADTDYLFQSSLDSISAAGIVVETSSENFSGSLSEDREPVRIYSGVQEGADLNSEDLYCVTQSISGTDWTLRMYYPKQLLVPDNRQTAGTLLIIAAFCMGILFLVGHVLSLSVTGRVKKLNAWMEEVENGNLDVNVEAEAAGKDEIGEMTGRFSRMVTSLKGHIHREYIDEITRKDAQLRALQAQINPHFLYNTLSLIRWKALEKGDEESAEIVQNLSRFYRMVLNGGKRDILVRQEIEMIESYLMVQSCLHDDNFAVDMEFSPEIMDQKMIGVVLQPIVENAIEHGLDERREDGRVLKLTGSLKGDMIRFTVEDNGPGLTAEQFRQVVTEGSKGYGLKNVNDRLKIAYGDGCGVFLDTSIKEGTRICVDIPVNSSADGSEG